MSIKLTFIILILLSGLFMFGVNRSGAKPSSKYDAKKCTRFCHNHQCLHFNNKLKTSILPPINLLKNNTLNLSYQEINLLVYVLILPIILLILLYGIIRKST